MDARADVSFDNRFNRTFALGSQDGDFDEVAPLTEVYPVGLYIKRVPKFVFADADYWVPIYARIEGLPSGKDSGSVRIKNPQVGLFQNGNPEKEYEGTFPFVDWGIGNGTEEGASPTFKDQKKADIGNKARKKNGTLFFTTFVDNKQAMKNVSIGSIHLFNRKRKEPVPYFKLQNMEIEVSNETLKNVNTAIEPPEKKEKRRPAVFADRKIGPVLEPEEKDTPNVKLSRHNDYVGDIFQKKVVLNHVDTNETEVINPQPRPTPGQPTERKLLNSPEESDSDITKSDVKHGLNEFEHLALHVRKDRHRKKSVSQGPVPFNNFLGNAELNLADGFISSGENVRAVSDIQQGAYFYISYGKNDDVPLGNVDTMDLNDNRAIVQMDSTDEDFNSTKPFPESYNAVETFTYNGFISDVVSVTSLASSVFGALNVPGFITAVVVDGALSSFIKVVNEKESSTGILATIEHNDFVFDTVNGKHLKSNAWKGRTISKDQKNTGFLDHIGGGNQFTPFKLLNDSAFGFKRFVDENAEFSNVHVGRRLEFRVRINISASIFTSAAFQKQVLGEIMYGHNDAVEKGVLRNVIIRVDEGQTD